MNTSPYNKTSAFNVDHELMLRARTLHEEACEHIDSSTRAKLAEARREALAVKDRRPGRVIWLPAAGAAAACALVIGLVWFKPQPNGPTAAAQTQVAVRQGADMPLDADARQLDLYQNLDFYQWLAQQPKVRSLPRGGGQ